MIIVLSDKQSICKYSLFSITLGLDIYSGSFDGIERYGSDSNRLLLQYSTAKYFAYGGRNPLSVSDMHLIPFFTEPSFSTSFVYFNGLDLMKQTVIDSYFNIPSKDKPCTWRQKFVVGDRKAVKSSFKIPYTLFRHLLTHSMKPTGIVFFSSKFHRIHHRLHLGREIHCREPTSHRKNKDSLFHVSPFFYLHI